MAGAFDDLIPAAATPAPAVAPSAAAPQSFGADPFADLIPTAAAATDQPYGTAPPDIRNVPTPRDDPIYHGAVPIAQAPDQGAATAFATGVGGVPVVGPAILGGVERAAAAARSVAGGGSYGDELQHVQDMTTAARQQHPAAAFAGDLSGAAAALAPVTAAAPGVFGLGGPVSLGNIAAGATTGAAIGAGDAAVRSGGDLATIRNGAEGGAAGGAFGPPLGAVASRVGNAVGGYIGRALSPDVGVSRPVADILSRTIANDGTTAGQAAANFAAAGPNAMLVDASPGLSNILDTTFQRGGPGIAAARQAVEDRAAGASGTINSALDQAFGPAQGLQTAGNAIRTGSADARQAAYDTAYATPIDYTTDQGRALEDMITNRVPPGIIARANAQMRIDGTPTQQMIMRPDGTLETMPDVRQVDYITRSLNDVAQRGDGQGALGGNTSEGRSFGNLARDLRGTLRQAVPAYDTALQTAADPINARNALEFGSTMLNPSTPRDVVADRLSTMTGPELDQVRQGIRSQMSDAMANVRRTMADPNVDAREAMAGVKAFSSQAAQDKLAMVLDPQTHAQLQGAIGNASRALDLRASAARGSGTYGRQAMDQTIDQAAQPGILTRMLTSGGVQKMTKAPMEALLGARPEDILARKTAYNGELGSLLTQPASSGIFDQLLRARGTQDAALSFANAVPYGQVASTGGILAGLLAADPRRLP